MNVIHLHLADLYKNNKQPSVNKTTQPHFYKRKQLLKKEDWCEWEQSKWLQLDQYECQGIFGAPCAQPTGSRIFNIVWTYCTKMVGTNKRKLGACVMAVHEQVSRIR